VSPRRRGHRARAPRVAGEGAEDRIQLTRQELREIIQLAIREALVMRPVPPHVTVTQAAEMMQLDRKTVAKLNLPRNKAGRIPYSAIMDALVARDRL
jgi:hypothetical protein